MANKITFVLDATDRASAVVKKFNAQIDKLFKPVTRAQQGFAKLSKNIGENRIVKGLAAITKGAGKAVSKITEMGAAIAGVSIAAGAVAVAELGRQWVFAGAALARTSAITGIGTTRLQSLSGAAQIFGLQTEDMTAGLKNLGDTMEDALYGRNQEALMMMNLLGISVKHTKEGAIDTAAGFMDIAKAISRIKNVQAQGLVARSFGMEALLPLLQQGPAGLKKLEDIVKRTNAIMSPDNVKKMQAYSFQLTELGLSIRGLGNTIAVGLLPDLSAGTDQLIKFIEKTTEAAKAGKYNPNTLDGAKNWFDTAAQVAPPVAVIKNVIDWTGTTAPGAFDPPVPFKDTIDKLFSRKQGGQSNNPTPTGGEARMQEILRKLIPDVRITSGARTKAANARAGGAEHSYHLRGEAVDFDAAGQTKASIRVLLQKAKLPIKELLSADDERRMGNRTPSDFHWAWGDLANKGGGNSALDTAAHENGSKKTPPAPAQSASDPSHVIVEFQNAPPGTKAKVKKQGDTPAVLRVNYSLPEIAGP